LVYNEIIISNIKKMNFAICLTKFYISRCEALLSSLKNYNINIYLLCFDRESYKYFYKKNVNCITINKIKSFEKNFDATIKNRKLIDQIVTSRPIFLKFLLKKFNLKEIFLLDSDIFFFSDPKNIKKEIGKASIAYCDHRFNKKLKKLADMYGKYNAGFIYIKFDKYGKKFLNEWSSLCKEWCEFTPSLNKFSDQKYLEQLKKKSNNIKIIKNPCINLAPWNLQCKEIVKKEETILVNNKPLIFFHFHGLRKLTNNIYVLGTSNYNFFLTTNIKKILFAPYINYLKNHKSKDFFWKKNSLIDLFIKSYIVFKKIILNDFYLVKKIVTHEKSINNWNNRTDRSLLSRVVVKKKL
jgi:hypothetical protein